MHSGEPTERTSPSAEELAAAAAHIEAHGQPQPKGRRQVALLVLGALGIVYGDIGTSPLYAMREAFAPAHGIAISNANVLGILSLIFWALLLVVVFKYLTFIMRADNRGEGGILALLALLHGRRRAVAPALVLGLGLFGTALLFGEGVITPAISVLSAVEGLEIATPALQHFVIPITVVILIGLFMMQKHGTARVGAIFGPITLVWFIALAALGVMWIVREPAVLAAVNPLYAVRFFANNGTLGYLVLGSVVLVITGAEALYADMGHFGRQPIRIGWFAIVFPALLLNYFGQGALMLARQDVKHPLYEMVPTPLLWPMVVLATMATIIASQALISGSFSLTRQAIQLGYLPRLEIVHTSARAEGQIYIPQVNTALMVGCIALVLGFRSVANLAAAYGLAVVGTMAISSVLFFFVASERWHWKDWQAAALAGVFLSVELAFLGANAVKFLHGAWLPLVGGAAMFTAMSTWKRGRSVLADIFAKGAFPIDLFIAEIKRSPPVRVSGTAVFMSASRTGVPPVLLHHLKHNKVLHDQVVLLSFVTEDVPHVMVPDRLEMQDLGVGIYRVSGHYGFMEKPVVPELLAQCKTRGLKFTMADTSFYLGRETLIPSRKGAMMRWRKKLFALMHRNAQSATAFFEIPANRVVELGAQIEV
ncbi:MAG: potassium transporter Kup [Gemmatimonadota bacterium]